MQFHNKYYHIIHVFKKQRKSLHPLLKRTGMKLVSKQHMTHIWLMIQKREKPFPDKILNCSTQAIAFLTWTRCLAISISDTSEASFVTVMMKMLEY